MLNNNSGSRMSSNGALVNQHHHVTQQQQQHHHQQQQQRHSNINHQTNSHHHHHHHNNPHSQHHHTQSPNLNNVSHRSSSAASSSSNSNLNNSSSNSNLLNSSNSHRQHRHPTSSSHSSSQHHHPHSNNNQQVLNNSLNNSAQNHNSNQSVQRSSSSQQQQPQSSHRQQSQQHGQSNTQHHHHHHQSSSNNSRQQPSNSSSSSQNQTGQNQSNAPPLPVVLPKGWKREEIFRTKGISSGIVDVVYVPSANSECSTDVVGKKFRNKVEMQRHLGNKYDMSLLDFKSGKVLQSAWRRQRRVKSLAANPNNYLSAAKYDVYFNLPVRQVQNPMFSKQQTVSYITNNHKNDPTPSSVLNQTTNTPNQPNGQLNIQNKNEKSKPTQLFWELRFNDLKSVDTKLENNNELLENYELANLSKFKNFTISDENAMRSVATSWYINQNRLLLGQDKEFAKNSRIFIERDQPLIPATTVKEEDVKNQELKVKELRKQLELCLLEYENMDIEDYVIKNELKEMCIDDVKDNSLVVL